MINLSFSFISIIFFIIVLRGEYMKKILYLTDITEEDKEKVKIDELHVVDFIVRSLNN